MYENIRKPGLLKNIPLLFIRALPALYYYGKFADKCQDENCRQLFLQNLDYLKSALEIIQNQINADMPPQIREMMNHLDKNRQQDILPAVERLTLDLSDYCNANMQECHDFYKKNKQMLIDLYREKVNPLHILVSDTDSGAKLPHLLCDFCYYDVQNTRINSDDYPTLLAKNDFVVLTNLNTSDIHRQIDQIDSFHKPALIVAGMDDAASADKAIMRHAMQLIRRGFPVIFKIFTPIRLFTSIEKTFIRYHAYPTTA